MKVDAKLIKRIATVSRLTLTEKEIKTFVPQVSEVLEAFSKLSEVDTENVEPAFHPIEVVDAMREDIPHKCLSQDEALSTTTQTKDGFFKGPKAIEK